MKRFLLSIGVAVAALLGIQSASAQVQVGKGQLSGSLESNNIFYVDDPIVESRNDKERELQFGSHDFLKLDYTLDRFSAGIQIDGYLPTLFGYDIYDNLDIIKGSDSLFAGFLTKYIQWEDKDWGIRVGDIFDQFGNGIIFRAYEDRALAFNNSVAGLRAHYNFDSYFAIKVIAGAPRLYTDRSNTWIWGGDLSLSLSELTGWQNGVLSLEGSYVGRYIKDFAVLNNMESDIVNMVSGRVNLDVAGFSLRGEYAAKLNEDIQAFGRGKGSALQIDLGYNYKRFSATATFRQQKNMMTLTHIYSGVPCPLPTGNTINYLPLLTRQYTYMLTNINPYHGVTAGEEIGGQIDLYYSLRNSKNRAKYWNFHFNTSLFFDQSDDKMAWLDINFDIDRQWNKKLKTTVLYSRQESNPHIGYNNVLHTFVGDVTYKFNKKHSMRVELQYLWDATDLYSTWGGVNGIPVPPGEGEETYGDWVAALVEYNLAPKFSFYVSGMYNLTKTYADKDCNGGELIPYYQIGASYTHRHFRVQLSYGRNRAGYVCSGGVCRMQPAFTGANLSLTASF